MVWSTYGLVSAEQFADYDAVIDVRSPSEFAHDHVPGAMNAPVLNDEERVRVGTLYRQSAFAARRLGAALVARHMADYIEQIWNHQPRGWRPLLYCWRGGQRSGSVQIIMRQIGWQADRIEGGYKAFRHLVMQQLDGQAVALKWRVISGKTGSGKTRLLHAIAAAGGQVLDLEALAGHKGSVLGGLPDVVQPSQKMFETRLWQTLRQLDDKQPVYVEAESRKIGNLHVPDALMAAMQHAPCWDVQASLAARVDFLGRDYAYAHHAPWVCERLQRLVQRQGHQTIQHWQQLAQAGRWPELIEALLVQHYDPLYRQSQRHGCVTPVQLSALDDAALADAARYLLAQDGQ